MWQHSRSEAFFGLSGNLGWPSDKPAAQGVVSRSPAQSLMNRAPFLAHIKITMPQSKGWTHTRQLKAFLTSRTEGHTSEGILVLSLALLELASWVTTWRYHAYETAETCMPHMPCTPCTYQCSCSTASKSNRGQAQPEFIFSFWELRGDINSKVFQLVLELCLYFVLWFPCTILWNLHERVTDILVICSGHLSSRWGPSELQRTNKTQTEEGGESELHSLQKSSHHRRVSDDPLPFSVPLWQCL